MMSILNDVLFYVAGIAVGLWIGLRRSKDKVQGGDAE